MIILLTLLYGILASGGYLDSFGSLGNFRSAIFNFQSSDDATTIPPIPKPINHIVSKNDPRFHKIGNDKSIPRIRHFNTGYLSKKGPSKRGRYGTRRPMKTQIPPRVRRPFKYRPTTTKIPTTTKVATTIISQRDPTTASQIHIKRNATDNKLTFKDKKRRFSSKTETKSSTTSDIPLQTSYVTKYIERCPAEGYFFKRDLQGTNSNACYLCFCKENGTAVCWQRNNKRCDAESYKHNWVKRRASRSRRSPISFGDIFLGEATRDVLNTNGKTTCKAGEASYSEGCPPDDWCVGCTVCDCNINGKWDCHLLSFCTEVDKKKNKKGEKGELKGHFYDPFDVPKTRRSERKAAQKAVQNLAEKMAQDRHKNKIGKSNTRRYFFKNGTLVNQTIFDIRKRKKSPSILNQSSMEIQRWSDLNMKIRKIPDQITRQILIDKRQKNAKKVSEAANFFVRKMPNKKSKQIIDQKRAQAVNVLAKRQPNRKKKRQVLLPSGVKVPKELLDRLPPGMIYPTRSPPGDHFPKKSHVKRVLPNQMAATKPSRQMLPEKKQVNRSLGLGLPDKKLVKRNAKYNDASNDKQKRKDKQPLVRKKVPAAKSTNKSGKEPKKKRENTKVQMKSILKLNVNKKYNQQKFNKRKNNKNIPKNKGNQNTLNNNQHSKSKNTVKNSPNNKKNIKPNNNIRKNNNNQQYKTKQTNNGNSNKGVKSYVGANNMKKHIKHNDGNKKQKPSAKNKNAVNKKPINKNLKESSNRSSPKISNTREKRSDGRPWVKTVTEGNKVTKFAPKVDKFSTKPGKNVTKTITKNTPKAGSIQLNRRMINEEVKKLTGNIQANLNRKVLKVVEQMLGQKLDTKSKKVKRSVLLEPELIHENMSFEVVNDSEIDLSMTPNPDSSKEFYRKQIKETVHRRDIGEEKEGLSLPFIEFSGQKVKRFANEDRGYNESRHIPFIVKKRPLPPVKHVEKKAFDFHLLQTPASKPPNVSLHKVFQEIDKYLKYPMLTTQDYLTTDFKRSVTLSKIEEKDDGDLNDIHIPIKKLARNIVCLDTENTASTFTKDKSFNRENVSKLQTSETTRELSTFLSSSEKGKRSAPLMKKIVRQKRKPDEKHFRSNFIKKLQKVLVDKMNKVKLNRHIRSASIRESGNPNLKEFGNEISTNSLQDTKTTQNKSDTADSILKYYKYAIDDFLETNSKPVDKNYVTEFFEVYTKNVAVKRSVDQHIETAPNFDILQMSQGDFNNVTIPVNSSNENNDESTATSSNFNENKTTAHDDDKFKVRAAELLPFNPTNVLDDKVVIIQDQNVSFINSLSDFITDSQTSSPVANDSDINLINETVIGINNHEKQPTENNNILREDIEKSVTMVDQSVVIINDEMSAIMPTTDSHLSLTTDYKLETKSDINMYMLVDKENDSFLTTTTEKNELSSNKEENLAYVRETLIRPITNTSLKLNDDNNTSISITRNHFNETKVKKVNNDEIIIVREHDFKPQKSLTQLENSKKYLLKLATENYIKSEYKVENKVIKQNTSVMGSKLKMSEATPAKSNITIKQIKNNVSSLKPLVKNYLKYDVDTKSYTLKPNSSKPKKGKKLKKTMIQKDVTDNSTEQAKPKHRIDDYVVIVLQKDLYTKIKDNSTKSYNNTFSIEKDLKIKINTTLTSIVKADDWLETTTLKIVEQNYTTQFLNNVYSTITTTEVLPLFENQQSTNQTNAITQNVAKSYDVRKTGFKIAGKHKLKKILTTLYNKTNKDERYYNRGEKYFNKEDRNFITENQEGKYFMKESVTTQKNMNKTNNLKGFFKKLLSGFKFNKHTRKPSKRFKILKYLQKFFKMIFSDDGKHKKNKTISHQLNRRNIIETLCSSFGPCNIIIKNKAKLQSQIDHLNSETYKMLRSVKIIKGLLKLVDMAKNDKNFNNKTSAKTNFKNDVQKLHAILRDTYSNAEQMDKLTETQKIQIQYIKNSTQNFIQSAAKFTMVLNEIINIITVPDHRKNKDVHYKTSVERKDQRDIKKILTSRNINKPVAIIETNESLKKLKELISKYSLIQNTFMRKIFTVLTRLDSKQSIQKKNKVVNPTSTTNTIAQNKTEEIQVYTKNIIQNLRKLKNLAQNLNGDMGQVRRKRDLRNDDSLEYMLMLMEYLLKQQHPLDAAPVNDGIDLLIEAIKSAPNIKSIKKKVLPVYRPKQITFGESNLTKHTSDSSELNQSKETSSESNSKPSKEINATSSYLEEPKFNAIDQSMDDEGEDQDYYMFNKRAHAPTTAAITTSRGSHTNVYLHKQVTTDAYHNTIPDVEEVTKPKTKSNKHEYSDKVTKFDFYDKFVDDEASTSTTSSTPEFEYMTIAATDTPEMTTKTEMTTKSTSKTQLVQIRKYHQGEDDVSASKSRIDWLDETYEEEIKAETQKASSTTSKPFKLNKKQRQNEKFNVTKGPKKSIDISGLSKETIIEEEGSKKSTAAKEILYKKEMGLLNSLDYGTEKTDLDASSSEESGTIDKYAGDAFATYFRQDKI